MLINFTVFTSGILSFPIISKFGRKTIVLAGFILACAADCIIGIGLGKKMPTLSLIGGIVFMINYGCTLGPVVWLYIPEVVPSNMVSLTTAFNWISFSTIVTLFPITTD